MVRKGGKAPVKAYCGYMEVVPYSSGGSGSSKRGRNESYELEKTSKTTIYDYDVGFCTKFAKTRKAGYFVDKRNGKYGYKEEVKYESNFKFDGMIEPSFKFDAMIEPSFKFDDMIEGCTTEYQTQVKSKKVTSYKNPKKGASKSGYKRISYKKCKCSAIL